VTAVTLIGCGFLFLLEAALGMFWPSIYRLIGTASRLGKASPQLRLIGGGLFLCGVVCLAVGIPPKEPAQWFLLAAGAALVFKGTLLMGFPRALKDNPAAISADPLQWKVKCGLRAAIGFALVCWGVILLWPNSGTPSARSGRRAAAEGYTLSIGCPCDGGAT
jgi:uncharacterized protein YjeT (DUF2065 family)